MSNVVAIGVTGRVITISMVSLGDMNGSRSVSVAISRLSISRPLAISMAITAISIATIVSMQTLWASMCVAATSIRMVGNTSIARLGSSEAGKGYNNCYNLSCHGYKYTKLS